MTTETLIAPPAGAAPAGQHERAAYRCACGRVVRVFGGGRHRVYFELSDARLADPLMDRVCPACDRGLPGTNRP
jgi:hypothetical protein